MKRVDTSFSVIVTSWLVIIPLKEGFTLFMAGYNYTNKCLISSWLVTIPLKKCSISVIVTSHAESEHFF
jgi:hypothetical protein